MDIDANDLGQMIIEALSKIKLNTMNIIVVGRSGTGKSTLINSVFRENLAETGIGKPVTNKMSQYTKGGLPLVIYDTKGFELDKVVQDQVKEEILATIRRGNASGDVNKAIHCIWYCISTASNRIEPQEIKWLKELTVENQKNKVPVPIIIILTQSFDKNKAREMRKTILAENLDIVEVIPVLAQDYDLNDEYTAKAYGLDVLIKIMELELPEPLKDTLQNIQKVSLDTKIQRARAAVKAATISATAIGATPIPISDAALLIPTQVTMVATITKLFGINVTRNFVTTLVASTLGAGGMTILGKSVVSGLLKLIPGVGSVVGGAIAATTAGILTTALGESYIKIMSKIYNGKMSLDELSNNSGISQMKELFQQELKTGKNSADLQNPPPEYAEIEYHPSDSK